MPKLKGIKPGSDRAEKLKTRYTEAEDGKVSALYRLNAEILGHRDIIPMTPEMHYALCLFAERATGIPEIDDARVQLIQLPRGVGKSTLITKGRAMQRLLSRDNYAIGIANETMDLAKKFLANIKEEFESNEAIQALWPERIPEGLPDPDTTWASEEIVLKRTRPRPQAPSVKAAGAGKTVTGYHMDEWIVDDLISEDLAENAIRGHTTEMEKMERWIQRLEPLLADRTEGPITLIGTPWFAGDTYEYVEKYWGNLEQDADLRNVPPDFRADWRLRLPNGKSQTQRVYRRGELAVFRKPAYNEQGESAFPEIWSTEELDQMRQKPGSAEFFCLPSDERIDTPEGRTTANEIAEGDSVFSGEGSIQTVTGVSTRNVSEDLIQIRATGVPPFRLTTNHRVQTTDGWKQAGNITTEDGLIQPISNKVTPTPWFNHEDLWWLLGHWLAEGSVSLMEKTVNNTTYKNFNIQHVSGEHEREIIERVSSIVQNQLDRKGRIYRKTNKNGHGDGDSATWAVNYGHDKMGRLLYQIKQEQPGHKVLPLWAETAAPIFLEAMLNGYIAGDGCDHRHGGSEIVSVCRPLLEQFQRITARLGRPAHLRRTGQNHKQGNQQLWSLHVRDDNGTWAAKVIDDKITRRVRSVESISYDGPVYNIEVEDDATFTIGNVTVHNSANYLLNPTEGLATDFDTGWLKDYEIEMREADSKTMGSRMRRSFYLHFRDASGERHSVHSRDLVTWISVDPAFSDDSNAARTAIPVVGSDGQRVFLLEDFAERGLGPTDMINQVGNFAYKYRPQRIYLETIASQQALVEPLERKLQNLPIPGANIEEISSHGKRKKEMRIRGLEPWFRRGLFHFHPSQRDFLNEYETFPRGQTRDLLDALAFQRDAWESVAYRERGQQNFRQDHERKVEELKKSLGKGGGY